jgi:hypothetical protein
MLRGMTTTVWISISSAISSPVGATEPATRAAHDERGGMPDNDHRGQQEPASHGGDANFPP